MPGSPWRASVLMGEYHSDCTPAQARPRQVHLHFHGVTAEDVAEVLGRVNREDR
jgi:hypothetical protein